MVGAGPKGLLLVAPLLMAFVAGAQAQPEAAPTFDFTPREGKPGQVVAVRGTGCMYRGRALARADVDLSRNVREGGGEPFRASGSYPVQADGSWNGEFLVPAHTPPGPYFFGSSCAASDFVVGGVDAAFRVLDRCRRSP